MLRKGVSCSKKLASSSLSTSQNYPHPTNKGGNVMGPQQLGEVTWGNPLPLVLHQQWFIAMATSIGHILGQLIFSPIAMPKLWRIQTMYFWPAFSMQTIYKVSHAFQLILSWEVLYPCRTPLWIENYPNAGFFILTQTSSLQYSILIVFIKIADIPNLCIIPNMEFQSTLIYALLMFSWEKQSLS